MAETPFTESLARLVADHRRLIARPNEVDTSWRNGLFERFRHPVVTAAHTPIHWRYDLDERTNPHLIERLAINAALNPGAMIHDGKVVLMCRMEGADRKSFFAVAESDSGVDGFRFRPRPVVMPETPAPDTNVYDMRLVAHEDGWIYGLFCTERADPDAPPGDLSSAVAQCGVARTTVDKMLDYVTHTPPDALRSAACVAQRIELIDRNLRLIERSGDGLLGEVV